jgi:nitrate ABC transporter ATP-binding subunit
VSLIVDAVRKQFVHRGSSQEVLRGVDLEVHPGELVALIGHSGCGKSTLLRAIGGLLPVDSGRISLDGEAVAAPGPDRAMVFQHYSLLPRLSLLDNVRHAVRAARPDWSRDQAEAAAERYLTAVGLWEHRGKRPSQVSGGMQQRTAVARAFAVEPRVLLLDEPFGALDALTRARLQAQLIDLWRSESDTEIVLMVTHGIDEAILLADRIVVMGNGPGPSVIDVISVDLPRPRDRVSVIDEPAYRAVQARLLELLMSEAAPDAAA